MPSLDSIEIIPRQKLADERGWFIKVINGKEALLPAQTGEIYLVMAIPGQVRGNHYHPKANEWFTLIAGKAELIIAEPETEQQRIIALSADEPQTIFVPAGLAHAFHNPASNSENMILVAYSSELYDPTDTIPFKLV